MKAHHGSLISASAQGVAVPRASQLSYPCRFAVQIRRIRVTRFSPMQFAVFLNIEIADEPRVLLDEVAARLDLVAHEHLKDPVRLDRVLHVDLEQRRSEEHTSELQSQSNLVCRL